MITDWRRDRRIGPAPLVERLDIYWKLPLLAFAPTVFLVPFTVWLKFGWPPALTPGQIVFMWCWSFTAMMLIVSEVTWRNGRWREFAGLVGVTASIIAIAWFVGTPIVTELVPPVIIPVSP